MEQRREWFSRTTPSSDRHRLLVAVEPGGRGAGDRVLGYASRPPLPAQAGVRDVGRDRASTSRPTRTGRDVGTALYMRAFDGLCDGEDLHRAYAGIGDPQPGVDRAAERFGFERRVAYFTEQGRKFGRYWDVALVREAARLTAAAV